MAQAFFGGVHPNDMKAATNEKAIEQLEAPAEVVIPMSMHIGAPCKPIVAVGDKVTIGQKIGEPGGFVSAPIHASVSGTVKAVEPRPFSMGGTMMSVVIENDFQNTVCPDIHPVEDPDSLTPEQLVEIVKNAGIVVATPSTMIGLGNMMQPQAYLTILGVVLAGWMMAKGIRLAMLITILIVAALGIVTGVTPTDGIHNLFSGSFKIFPTETIFQVDFKQMLTVGIVGVLFSITMVDLFDNMSTLIGLSYRAGFMDKQGNIPGLDRALISDSIATMGAGLIGTPTSTAILESAVGIEAGARTGLCALFLAGFFALTLFVTPLLTLVPAFATACVLIIVGYMMLQGTASRINFSDITTGLPCFLTTFMMPFTFNIATGLAFGVISFVLLKLLAGKKEEITLTMAVLAVVFVGILISH